MAAKKTPLARDDRQCVSMGCVVLIVQHGEKDRVPGDPGLTGSGRLQAEATADWLHSKRSVTRIVTSPLRRAVETSEPIARLHGLVVTVDDRLRERMNWEGTDGQTIEEFTSEWHRASADRFYVPTGGDSSSQAAARFIAALDEIAATTNDGEVVVVAHGGVTVDVLRTLLGDEPLLARAPSLIDDGVPCCAITTLRQTHGRWEAEPPSTSHLHA
jgi:broad specificity phosphatase PhoE